MPAAARDSTLAGKVQAWGSTTRMLGMSSLQEHVLQRGLLPLVGQADDSKSKWEATLQQVCRARRAKEEGGRRSEFPECGFGDKEKQNEVVMPRSDAP